MVMQLANITDFSRCRPVLMPDGTWSDIKDHVKVGARAIVANPFFGLFDEMGAMKTAQTIIGAQYLYTANVIDRVIVFTPHSVRDVWFDPQLGELAKHLWLDLPAKVSEFHQRIKQWDHGPKSERQLRWIITNYEFIGRSKERTAYMLQFCGPKTLLVLDESSAVKSRAAMQTKACNTLRKRCGRVLLLNGTPIANNPLDMMSQGNIMHPGILECRYVSMFRDRYAVMASHGRFPQIVSWKNLDDLQQRFAPYVLRRLKKDCLDLPETLPSVTLTATLTPATWKIYKEMKNEMVAWLNKDSGSIAQQAATKALRLSQITSGFLGGVEQLLEPDWDERPGFTYDGAGSSFIPDKPMQAGPVQEVGREKLDLVLAFYREHLEVDPAFRLLVWCRFRPEIQRLMREVQTAFQHVSSGQIIGGQTRDERERFRRLLNPQTAPEGPIFAAGTYGTGAMGHNYTAVHTVINCSYDYSLFKFLQSSARVDRPGQVHPVSNFDVVAVGPAGQKTIDHAIIKARRNKEDVATWTAAAWLQALAEE